MDAVASSRGRVDETGNPLFTVYETADGWIAVAALLEPQWPSIAEVLDLAHLLEDDRFTSLETVLEHRAEFRPIMAERMRSDTTANWVEIIRESGAWVAPVNTLEDLATDEDILLNEYMVTFDDGFMGPPSPFDVDDFRGARGNTADYAEHSDEVLAELGYSSDDIIQLKVDGAVW